MLSSLSNSSLDFISPCCPKLGIILLAVRHNLSLVLCTEVCCYQHPRPSHQHLSLPSSSLYCHSALSTPTIHSNHRSYSKLQKRQPHPLQDLFPWSLCFSNTEDLSPVRIFGLAIPSIQKALHSDLTWVPFFNHLTSLLKCQANQ